eukprot:CAMPEP_0174939786 /NCGR_PEP_ID=MMETSP1355-20121228/67469_1 /TAXON_ID=464990 /ORGANISM="Hemiselmis tepida, Strain CCMP443" /LENGTH=60 /DNA_ID=CAMNT_0016186821 /DNA_START=34 /DNA_END=213 /DNA_ORIENTATION=+
MPGATSVSFLPIRTSFWSTRKRGMVTSPSPPLGAWPPGGTSCGPLTSALNRIASQAPLTG